MASKRHWMDEIVDSLRQRITDTIPVVAEGVRGDTPFGYTPPNPTDEVKSFLNMPPQQRQQLFITMGPEKYQQWSTHMMKELTTRFGPAAQMLMPMLEGAPIESLATGQGLDGDGSMGVASAQAELTDILGFDPFGGGPNA